MKRTAYEKVMINREARQSRIDGLTLRIRQALVLPTLHYKLEGRDPRTILDELGAILVQEGLRNVTSWSKPTNRWYCKEEGYSIAGTGSPITIVNARSGKNPEYRLLRPDRTIEDLLLEKQDVVSVNLQVENPNLKISPRLLGTFVGEPIYETIKDRLFKFSGEFPLVDDDQYRNFVSQYSRKGKWLVSEREPKKN